LSRLPVSGDRKSLLLGTALASTLLIGGILMPAPAGAVVNSCTDPGPDAVFINSAAPISCINTETRNEPGVGFAIELRASGAASYIYVHSSGELTASSNMQNTFGIFASTQDANSRIDVVNLGDISVTATGNHHYAFGLVARTSGNGSPITSIVNSGDMSVTSENKYGSAYGIYARTEGADSGIYSIANSGTLVVTGGGTDGARAIGIFARTDSSDSPLSIVNSGDITVTATVETGTYAASAFGIFAGTYGSNSPIGIENSGDFTVTATATGNDARAYGIAARTDGSGSPIGIENSGDITATAISTAFDSSFRAYGISAKSLGAVSPIGIENSGGLSAGTDGIFATGLYGNISIVNDGTIYAGSIGIHAGDCQGPICSACGARAAGVNFFNPSANTSVFAKVDVTFGDDLDGVGGKAACASPGRRDRLLFPAFLLVRFPRANIRLRRASHLTESAARIGCLCALRGGRGRCRARRLRFGLPRCRGWRRRGLLRFLDRRPGQHLPCIGMVASDQTGLLLIAFDGETSAFLYRLNLVGDLAAEFLVERVLERGDPPAQGEDGLLQMRDVLLQAGHPVLVVLDVIAIGETERLGRRGECKGTKCGDDGSDGAHTTLPLASFKRSEATRRVVEKPARLTTWRQNALVSNTLSISPCQEP
jgi:hypothetical protein